MSRIGKSTETESRSVLAGEWGKCGGKLGTVRRVLGLLSCHRRGAGVGVDRQVFVISVLQGQNSHLWVCVQKRMADSGAKVQIFSKGRGLTFIAGPAPGCDSASMPLTCTEHISQAFQVERHAPAAPAHMHDPPSSPNPWMPPCFHSGLGAAAQARRNVRLGGDAPCSAAAPAPRPRQRLRRRQADRQAGVTLGSDRGSHSLVGFLLELPEGREKGSEKGHLGRNVPTPETLRPRPPASQSCCQGDSEQDISLLLALLTHQRTIKRACFWATKALSDCQTLLSPVPMQVPLRKVKPPCGLAPRVGQNQSQQLLDVPIFRMSPLRGWAHTVWPPGPYPRARQVDTHVSRFPGADNERSSRRLPSNGFPKERFRIMGRVQATPSPPPRHKPSSFLAPPPAGSQGLWLAAGLRETPGSIPPTRDTEAQAITKSDWPAPKIFHSSLAASKIRPKLLPGDPVLEESWPALCPQDRWYHLSHLSHRWMCLPGPSTRCIFKARPLFSVKAIYNCPIKKPTTASQV
ncbi:hypothetical protein Cadr_000027975 [Camelus dromedarius]|uniref:Uncharacterized protein n=1 Tax=Camelus dromedarius TaxID=9838 RepID=A0A5N4C9D6_CAMDR|nr:hypothetical protein Cadr_000027975 [Camelus dromedarius]